LIPVNDSNESESQQTVKIVRETSYVPGIFNKKHEKLSFSVAV